MDHHSYNRPLASQTTHFYHQDAASILLDFLASVATSQTEQAKWRALALRGEELGIVEFTTDLLASLKHRQRAFREMENTRLYALPDSSLLLLYHQLPMTKVQPLWQLLQGCMVAAATAENDIVISPEQLAAASTVYDLSVSWDAFYEQQKRQYTKRKSVLKKPEQPAGPTLSEQLAKLRQLATSTLFKSRLQQRAERPVKTVLLIEDDPLSIKLIRNALRAHPICAGDTAKIEEATNGVLGLRAYISNPADLVFLDIDMPQLSGQETLQQLLAIDPDAAVVMLSGNAFKEAIMEAMRTGAKGFVGKPFTPNKLLAYVEKYVAQDAMAAAKQAHVA